jgi:hypothetical protein
LWLSSKPNSSTLVFLSLFCNPPEIPISVLERYFKILLFLSRKLGTMRQGACIYVSLLLCTALAGASSPPLTRLELSFPRPDYHEAALMARWLVHASNWGVMSTTSRHLGGMPYGNPVSVSDGPGDKPTGRLLFYLTPMDATAYDLEKKPNATFTLCEAQLPGGCVGVDPEDPTCAKLSITGEVLPVPSEDVEIAKAMLFARHPAMKAWPKGHAFAAWELHPHAIRLLDWYGGPKDIAPADYYKAAMPSITQYE